MLSQTNLNELMTYLDHYCVLIYSQGQRWALTRCLRQKIPQASVRKNNCIQHRRRNCVPRLWKTTKCLYRDHNRSLKFFGGRWRIISCLPHIPLPNDEPMIASPFYQKKVFLSGVTAAKKTLVSRWKPHYTLISSCLSFRITECKNKWREKNNL